MENEEIKIPAEVPGGGVSPTYPEWEIKGIGKYIFLVEASDVDDAIIRIFKHVFNKVEHKADIFCSIDEISEEKRKDYYISDEYGVAIKNSRDLITGNISM